MGRGCDRSKSDRRNWRWRFCEESVAVATNNDCGVRDFGAMNLASIVYSFVSNTSLGRVTGRLALQSLVHSGARRNLKFLDESPGTAASNTTATRDVFVGRDSRSRNWRHSGGGN